MTFTGNRAGAFLEPKPPRTEVSAQPEEGGSASIKCVFIDFQ